MGDFLKQVFDYIFGAIPIQIILIATFIVSSLIIFFLESLKIEVSYLNSYNDYKWIVHLFFLISITLLIIIITRIVRYSALIKEKGHQNPNKLSNNKTLLTTVSSVTH